MRHRHIAGAARPPDGEYDADVVILSLGRPGETAAAIRSALAQGGVSRHVTVVDQGSGPEALAQLAALIDGRDDATLVALDHNHGVAGGRNRASALGHGRIICGLDNDAEFADATTLARLVPALDEDPALAAIGCRILLHASGADDLSSWGYPSGLLAHAGETFDAITFVGAGHGIRRSAWEAVGGYDETLFFCWEEFDFSLRAIEQGWRVCYRGDIAVRHKVCGDRRVAWSDTRWYHYVRNRLYIARKWSAGWPVLLPRFAFYLFKGMRHGLLLQTLRAWPAASRMSAGVAPRRHSAAARGYLLANDAAHRACWLTRPWREGPRLAAPVRFRRAARAAAAAGSPDYR
jgi:GT2 family glycosyltransferase